MSGRLHAEDIYDSKSPPDGAAKRASECPLDIAAMRALGALCEGARVRASCETEQPGTQWYNPVLVPNSTSN